MRLVSALVLASVVSVAPTAAQPRLTMEWQAMAERLVAQLDPQPGERILLLSRPGNFDEILPHLRYALMEVGAVDLGVVDVTAHDVLDQNCPVTAANRRDHVLQSLANRNHHPRPVDHQSLGTLKQPPH